MFLIAAVVGEKEVLVLIVSQRQDPIVITAVTQSHSEATRILLDFVLLPYLFNKHGVLLEGHT